VKFLYKISNATVFEILYLRSGFAMLVVLLILAYTQISPFDIKPHVFPYLGIRCITAFTGFAIEFFSISFTDLSKVVIVLYNPFLTSLMSFLLIRETVNKHDLLSFLLGVTGITLLTDPFAQVKDVNDVVGVVLALLSAVFFNVGFIAVRKVKSELNSWQIVFFFQVTNMLFAPACFMAHKSYENIRMVYIFEPYTLFFMFIIGVLTVAGNFCVNKTLQHEKAARATAYYNMELLYTFIFDICVSKSSFSVYEITGVSLIVIANLYMYFVNS